jgi:hypothetical protein
MARSDLTLNYYGVLSKVLEPRCSFHSKDFFFIFIRRDVVRDYPTPSNPSSESIEILVSTYLRMDNEYEEKITLGALVIKAWKMNIFRDLFIGQYSYQLAFVVIPREFLRKTCNAK